MAQLAAIDPNRNPSPKVATKHGKNTSPIFAEELNPHKSTPQAYEQRLETSEKPTRAQRVQLGHHADHMKPSPHRAGINRSRAGEGLHNTENPQSENPSITQASLPGDAIQQPDNADAGNDIEAPKEPQSTEDNNTDTESDIFKKSKVEASTPKENINSIQTTNEIAKPILPLVQASPAQISQTSNNPTDTELKRGLGALDISGTQPQATKPKSDERVEVKENQSLHLQPSEERNIEDVLNLEKSHHLAPQSASLSDDKNPISKLVPQSKNVGEYDDYKAVEKTSEPILPLFSSAAHHSISLSLTAPVQPTAMQSAFDLTSASPIPYSSLPIEISLRVMDGAKEISLDLSPKELGKLHVAIHIGDQSSIQISFQTENPHTLALLQHDTSHIRHALEQAGYATTDNSLQFSLRQDHSSNAHSGEGEQRKPSNLKTAIAANSEPDLAPSGSLPRRLYLSQLDLSV